MSVDWKAVAEYEQNYRDCLNNQDFRAAELEGKKIFEQTQLTVDESWATYAELLQLIYSGCSIEDCSDLCVHARANKIIQDGYIDVSQDAEGIHRRTIPELQHLERVFRALTDDYDAIEMEDLQPLLVFSNTPQFLKGLVEHYARDFNIMNSSKKFNVFVKFLASLQNGTCPHCDKPYDMGDCVCSACGKIRTDMKDFMSNYNEQLKKASYPMFALMGLAVVASVIVLILFVTSQFVH